MPTAETLIIGSSIVIRRRGLYKTDIKTSRGVKINDISDYIKNNNIKQYSKIVILAGGYDASANHAQATVREGYKKLLFQERSSCSENCAISDCHPGRMVMLKD